MTVTASQSWSGGDVARNGALDQRFALDVQGVSELRRTVRGSPEEGLKQVSRQFEAMFMNMILKSMREATPSSGLIDGQNEKIYRSMLDQQLSQNLSGRGMGLAEAMLTQLGRAAATASGQGPIDTDGPPGGFALDRLVAFPLKENAGIPIGSSPSPMPARAGAADLNLYRVNGDRGDRGAAGGDNGSLQGKVDDFVARMGSAAQSASAASGVPAPLILAQAALESGWGKREIRGDDGTQSFNLFGIKADRSWKGPVVETLTTEYVDGEPQKVRAKFRAYASYDEAFADYAKFMTRNPRYADVLSTEDPAAAAHGLQRAGYATDPDYGKKLVQIMQKFS